MPPARDCLKKEHKPLVPLKTLDVIFRRRYVKNSQYYFANRKHALKGEAGKATQPFRVPKTEKLLSYIKYSDKVEKNIYRKRLTQPLHLKDNLKMAATRDISRRLFIKEPPDDVRAVVEIHPEFYTVIEGRPLRSFDDIKVYVNNIQNYSMYRQQIGYRRDLIMKIDQTLVDETREHDAISENVKIHIHNFQKFLTEDYKKACAKIAIAEVANHALVAKTNQFLIMVSSITILNNMLFKLEAIRSVLKMYRSFLIFVAPIAWRRAYDENLIALKAARDKSIIFVSDVFEAEEDTVESSDIDRMVQEAKLELRKPLPPYLYFKRPQQIMLLFHTMELQSREYLIHLSKTGAPYNLLIRSIRILKQATKIELEYFQYYIESLNAQIAREKLNEIHLQEKFFRILNGPFYDTVASPETLKLKICIEFVYQEVFGHSDEDHENLHDPMKIMEVMFEELNLKLDSLDFQIVNQARNDFFAQDLAMMRNAFKAERELRAFREMTIAMHKAFLPPALYQRQKLKKFVDKKTRRAIALAEKRKAAALLGEHRSVQTFKKITDEEREGLLLFTEWCEGTNPVPYLKIYYQYSKPALEWQPSELSGGTSQSD